MPRKSQGYTATVRQIKGKWTARIRIKAPNGRPKEVQRQGVNKTHAIQLRDDLIREFKEGGVETIGADDKHVGKSFSGL